MLISMIISLVIILVILSYISTSSIVTDAAQVRMAYERVTYSFPIERVIVDSVENLCQEDAATCKAHESSGVITLSLSDLTGYIPSNFANDNMLHGTFGNIEIIDNYSTVRLVHDIPGDVDRKIYLSHFKGRKYGVAPQCQSGSKTTDPVCNSDYVYHDYATSLETRAALK